MVEPCTTARALVTCVCLIPGAWTVDPWAMGRAVTKVAGVLSTSTDGELTAAPCVTALAVTVCV